MLTSIYSAASKERPGDVSSFFNDDGVELSNLNVSAASPIVFCAIKLCREMERQRKNGDYEQRVRDRDIDKLSGNSDTIKSRSILFAILDIGNVTHLSSTSRARSRWRYFAPRCGRRWCTTSNRITCRSCGPAHYGSLCCLPPMNTRQMNTQMNRLSSTHSGSLCCLPSMSTRQ